MMGGGASSGVKHSSALQMNGQLTLEQMNLDNNDRFEQGDDDIDPFMMGRKTDTSGMQLKETNKFMGVSNTIG